MALRHRAGVAALRRRLDHLVENGTAESVAYMSAAAAVDEFRARLRDPSILDELPGNPIAAAFRVRTSDADAIRVAIVGDPAIDPALGLSVPSRSGDRAATP